MHGNSLRQQQRQRRRWQMTDTNSIRKAHWSFRIRWAKNFGWDTESYGGAPCKDHAFIYLFLKVLGMEQDLLFEISYNRCLKTPPPLLSALCSFRLFFILFHNLIHILSCKDCASDNVYVRPIQRINEHYRYKHYCLIRLMNNRHIHKWLAVHYHTKACIGTKWRKNKKQKKDL